MCRISGLLSSTLISLTAGDRTHLLEPSFKPWKFSETVAAFITRRHACVSLADGSGPGLGGVRGHNVNALSLMTTVP